VRGLLLALGVLAGIGMTVGSTGPWAWIEVVAYDGTASTSGRFTIAAAVAGVALLALGAWRRDALLAALAAAPAAAAVAVAGYHARDPDRYVGSDLAGIAEVGWGAVVTIVAGSALVVLSLATAWLLRRDRR
jgi:hypothetical protein